MSDESKMCICVSRGFSVVSGYDIRWIPMDPQPCCENCEREPQCSIYDDVYDKKFYCSFWKPKKVKK